MIITIGRIIALALILASIPYPYSHAGTKADKKAVIEKQLEQIDNLPEEIRKKVMLRLLEIMSLDADELDDMIDDAGFAATLGDVQAT